MNLKSIKKSLKIRNKQINKTFAQVEKTLSEHIHSDVKIYFDKVNTHQIHLDETTPDGKTRHIQSAKHDHSFRELVNAHIQKPQTNTLNQLTTASIIYGQKVLKHQNLLLKMRILTKQRSLLKISWLM